MKSFIVLLLISYIFTANPPTTVTLDLKEEQTLTTTDTQVKLTVTPDNAMTLSALTDLVLKSGSKTIELSCSFNPAVSCAADAATEVTCTVDSLTAGTYELAGADGKTITMTAKAGEEDITGVTPQIAGTPKTITVSEPAPSNDPPTSVTLDLATQSLTTANTEVKLKVTADKTMTLSALTNLVLQSTETASTTIALTCSFSPAVACAGGNAKEVTCTATLTAGTYKLAGADGKTITMTATYGSNNAAVSGVTPVVAGTPTTITVSEPAPSNDPPTSVTLDLKASQTLTVGKEGSVIIKVTAAGNPMTLSALTNLVLQSTETKTTTIALTCSFSPAVACAAGNAKEVTCKVAAPTTAGTYKLAAAADKSITMTATYGSNNAAVSVTPAVAATPTSLTVSTASSNENTNPSGEGESDDDNSSFLKFSYIMFFIAFLF